MAKFVFGVRNKPTTWKCFIYLLAIQSMPIVQAAISFNTNIKQFNITTCLTYIRNISKSSTVQLKNSFSHNSRASNYRLDINNCSSQ